MSDPKILITHSDGFHTDDVFASALLLTLFPDAVVTRTRDEAVIATGDIVYDVGKTFDPSKGRYDHHQEQAGKRDNGITYSSFGLLWREYGLQYCDNDEAVWELVDARLAVPIDANDNGQPITSSAFEDVTPFTIDDIVSDLNPKPFTDDDQNYDAQFAKAVELAKHVLARAKVTAQSRVASKAYVLDLYAKAEDKRLLVMDRQANVADALAECPELLYVVSPRPSGSWGVLAVSVEAGSFTPRRPFPEAWRARPAAEIGELSGVSDATFCHATGFYAAAESQAGALALAHCALAD